MCGNEWQQFVYTHKHNTWPPPPDPTRGGAAYNPYETDKNYCATCQPHKVTNRIVAASTTTTQLAQTPPPPIITTTNNNNGRNGGWHLVCEPNDDTVETEAFDIHVANELIGQTQQADGVKILNKDETEENEDLEIDED